MDQAFTAFMHRIQGMPTAPAPTVQPQTDAARIALLKIALDQFLLTPGVEQLVGSLAWDFALNVREDC